MSRQKITIEIDMDNMNWGKSHLEVFNSILKQIRQNILDDLSFYCGKQDVYIGYYQNVQLRMNITKNTIRDYNRTEKEYRFNNTLEMIDWIKLHVEGESTKFMLMERGFKNNNSFKY